jgi:hypothetical protein
VLAQGGLIVDPWFRSLTADSRHAEDAVMGVPDTIATGSPSPQFFPLGGASRRSVLDTPRAATAVASSYLNRDSRVLVTPSATPKWEPFKLDVLIDPWAHRTQMHARAIPRSARWSPPIVDIVDPWSMKGRARPTAARSRDDFGYTALSSFTCLPRCIY